MERKAFGTADVQRQEPVPRHTAFPLADGADMDQMFAALLEALKPEHIHGSSSYFIMNLQRILPPLLIMIRERGLEAMPPGVQRMVDGYRFLAARISAGRYQDYFDRQEFWGSEIPNQVYLNTQGVLSAPAWKGIPLYKNLYDLALYPMMLWDLKPATIIETGSANGGSAVWLADQVSALGLSSHVYSIDLTPPALMHPGVTFLAGDCNDILAALTPAMLAGFPRPWLFLEDAHVNLTGMLAQLHDHFRPGDYLFIEDVTFSRQKQATLAAFLERHREYYKVDSRYTDFYGYNACSAADAILRRV